MILVKTDKDGNVIYAESIKGPALTLELSHETACQLVLEEFEKSPWLLSFTGDSHDWDRIKSMTADILGIDGYDVLIGKVSLDEQYKAVCAALDDLFDRGRLVVVDVCDDGFLVSVGGRPLNFVVGVASTKTTALQRDLTAALRDDKPVDDILRRMGWAQP